MLRSNYNQVVKTKEKRLEEISIIILLKESLYHQKYQNYQISIRGVISIYKRYKIPRIESRPVLMLKKILSEIKKVNYILLNSILKMSCQQRTNFYHKDNSVKFLHKTFN